jgi:hypothetical protein
MIKQLMISGSNKHPNIDDDWMTSIFLDITKVYTKEELIKVACDNNYRYASFSLWVYEGEDYNDLSKPRQLVNGMIAYDMLFHPWDTDGIELIVGSSVKTLNNDFYSEWHKEIAMEAGMLGGCEAYNEVMGY